MPFLSRVFELLSETFRETKPTSTLVSEFGPESIQYFFSRFFFCVKDDYEEEENCYSTMD